MLFKGVLLVVAVIILAPIYFLEIDPEKPEAPIVKEISEVKGVEVTPTPTPTPTPEAKKASRPIYLGLWTEGFWDPGNNTLHPEILKNMESKIGKKVAIAHYYRGWEALDSPELLNELNTISNHGWRPMVSANPYIFSKCPDQGLPLYKTIASGNCDEFLTNIGKNLAKFAKPLFLRFAWEMNIPSMGWEIGKTGSSNQDFIDAWRRMHQIIYSQGATNVLWVFSPDVGNINYAQIYPGNEFVDWIGLDGYNWGTTQPWSKWQSFSQVFSNAYFAITKLAPNKPLMVSETNSTHLGGDKAAWYQDALEVQIPNNFPRIKAVVFYNEDRTQKESVNWLIDFNSSSLSSFKNAIQDSGYVSSF